jgi:thiol-disulfide isomerase/thioredoxin
MTSERLEERLRRVLAEAADQLAVHAPSPRSVMAAAQQTSGRLRRGRDTRLAWRPSLGGALTLLAVLGAVGIGVGSIALLAHRGAANRPAARTSRPVFAERLVGGKSHLLAAVRRLRGRPVVITVWASWCEPCQRDLRVVEAATPQFAGQVAFIGDDVRDTRRAGDHFLRAHPSTFPNYQSSSDLRPLLPRPLRFLPTTIFISATGRIDYEHLGPYVSRRDLDEDIVLRDGNGDPASDVLLFDRQNVFYPYLPATAGALRSRLNAATSAVGRKGFPIKVALIASKIDLGIIPQLLGKPQAYANYLDAEISLKHKEPLLVVMKDGYGVEGLSAAATAGAAKLSAPTGGTPSELAAAALSAVAKLSAAAGHPLH